MAENFQLSDNALKGNSMNWGLFESFCELLETIPIKAVLRAVDAERRMVEEDLVKKRTEMDEYVASVLGFCNFISLALTGIYTCAPALPFEHRAFYRRIIQELVDARELPFEITHYAEKIFCAAA